mgnify:CR=1 FL=1|jgi:hypothetical protein
MRIFIRHTPAPIKCKLAHRRRVHLQHQPAVDHLHNIALFLLAQRAAVGNGVPFSRQPRQQVAVACWAINTG